MNMQITTIDFSEYVLGWLFLTEDYPFLDMDNMMAALANALNMIEDDQDGIEAYLERKEYYKTLPHLQEG